MGANVLFQIAGEGLQAGAVVVEIDEDTTTEELETHRTQAELGLVESGPVLTHRRTLQLSLIVV